MIEHKVLAFAFECSIASWSWMNASVSSLHQLVDHCGIKHTRHYFTGHIWQNCDKWNEQDDTPDFQISDDFVDDC